MFVDEEVLVTVAMAIKVPEWSTASAVVD